MSLLLLFQSSGGSVSPGAAFGRSVNLDTFTSQFADPGQKIVPSDGTDVQANLYYPTVPSGQMSKIDQAQRRKNWAIFMEACLYACGGSGAANDAGWYSTGNNTAQEASPGSVFVPYPFWMEPYDTSSLPANQNYAPQFASTGFWTLPAFLTIWGNGRSGGGGSDGPNAVWNSVRSRFGPRIITVNAAFGWNPAGGPSSGAYEAYGGRALNGWCVDGIAIERRGSTSGDVFHTEDWTPATGVTHVSNHWKIKSLLVAADGNSYSGNRNVQNGCVIRGGLNCDVYELDCYGNDNAGWGLIVSAGFNNARTALDVGDTLTTHFRKVLVQGGMRGAAWLNANCLVDSLNLESPSPAPIQLVLNQVADGRIGYIHTENALDPQTGAGSGATAGWATDSAVVVVGATAPGAAEGMTSGYGYDVFTSTLSIDHVYVQAAYDPFGSPPYDSRNPAYAVQVNQGIVALGRVRTAGVHTSPVRVQPYAGGQGAAQLEYNSQTVVGAAPAVTYASNAGPNTYIMNRRTPVRGTATFASNTTVSVTFDLAQVDTSYWVQLTPLADPGGRLWVSGKTTSGFTINNSSSTSISIDWLVSRAVA